ncbi:MAG: hypothetical protein QXU87_08185 [Candidatus Caldarchaeum sp.]
MAAAENTFVGVFDLFVMSSLLSHEERLRMLEKMLNVRMRVDGRLL